jgi:DNA-binding NarL/FixJ family response regulator
VIRVLVADDEALIRDSFRLLLETEADMTCVGEAANGREAVALARDLRPDVVLMDIRMPVMDGLAATRLVSTSHGSAQVLVLTTYDSDQYLYEAIRAGAAGFCLKDMRREDLMHAIRTVSAGEAMLHPVLTRRLLEKFAGSPRPGQPSPESLGLTERETEVLRYVAQALSNSEIAARMHLGEATVKSHLASLMRKLDLRDRVQAVVFGYESGLVRAGHKDDHPPH